MEDLDLEKITHEDALRQSENYYRTIFETSGTAMLIIEEDTIISHANSYFEELFGWVRATSLPLST
jgi:PAS domain-containing protein